MFFGVWELPWLRPLPRGAGMGTEMMYCEVAGVDRGVAPARGGRRSRSSVFEPFQVPPVPSRERGRWKRVRVYLTGAFLLICGEKGPETVLPLGPAGFAVSQVQVGLIGGSDGLEWGVYLSGRGGGPAGLGRSGVWHVFASNSCAERAVWALACGAACRQRLVAPVASASGGRWEEVRRARELLREKLPRPESSAPRIAGGRGGSGGGASEGPGRLNRGRSGSLAVGSLQRGGKGGMLLLERGGLPRERWSDAVAPVPLGERLGYCGTSESESVSRASLEAAQAAAKRALPRVRSFRRRGSEGGGASAGDAVGRGAFGDVVAGRGRGMTVVALKRLDRPDREAPVGDRRTWSMVWGEALALERMDVLQKGAAWLATQCIGLTDASAACRKLAKALRGATNLTGLSDEEDACIVGMALARGQDVVTWLGGEGRRNSLTPADGVGLGAGRATVSIGLGVARTLQALHMGGLTHRDVKPENVVVTVRGPLVAEPAHRLATREVSPTVVDLGFAHTSLSSPALPPPSHHPLPTRDVAETLALAATAIGPMAASHAHRAIAYLAPGLGRTPDPDRVRSPHLLHPTPPPPDLADDLLGPAPIESADTQISLPGIAHLPATHTLGLPASAAKSFQNVLFFGGGSGGSSTNNTHPPEKRLSGTEPEKSSPSPSDIASQKYPSPSPQWLALRCATRYAAAPELTLEKALYDAHPVDAWGLGVLLHYVAYGRAPFSARRGPVALAEDAANGKILGPASTGWPIPASAPASEQAMGALIRGLLDPDPTKRCTISDAIRKLEEIT